MVRWWNGLGWSDARRVADQEIERVRAQLTDAQRGSTITTQEVARASEGLRRSRGVPVVAGATAATRNRFANVAVPLGFVGLLFGLAGVLPAVGLLVSIAGLLRSRRLANDGSRRRGLGQSLVGLVISIVGLIRWIPVDDIARFLNS